MVLGPLSGPVLGGWLTESLSWRWIFLINLPIGVLAVLLAAVVFDTDQSHPGESLDVIGMVMLSPGLASFLYGISMLPQRGTLVDPHVWIPAAIGVTLVAGFVWHALYRSAHPLIDLRLFYDRVVAASNAAMFFFAAAFFAAVLLLPSYFQQVFGHSPLQAGLDVIPEELGAALTMPFAGRITDHHGARGIVLVGVALMCTGMGTFSLGVWHQSAYAPTLLMGLLVFGAGMGCIMMPLSAAAVQSLHDQQIARGSTLINVTQRVAAAIGAAILAVLLTHQLNHSEAITTANQVAQLQADSHGAHLDPATVPAAALSPGFHHQVITELSHAYTLVFLTVVAVAALTCLPATRLRRSPPIR
jgi:EmrB/QacA subfamily drug resistance transporter